LFVLYSLVGYGVDCEVAERRGEAAERRKGPGRTVKRKGEARNLMARERVALELGPLR
jgi:hypothetical protein